MEKKPGKISATMAFNYLYGGSGRNLTPEGYQDALSRLKSIDPALARRVENTLAPFLKETIFQRRKISWVNTSQGVRARLSLLPDNPHVRDDVRTIREALGMPEDHIKLSPGDEFWKEVASRVSLASVRRVVEGNLASAWHFLHNYETTRGVKSDMENGGTLTEAMKQSAIRSAHVLLGAKGVPAWLSKPPSGPAPYDQSASPLDWAVGRLLERHKLPWAAATPLSFYVLTENPDWLGHIELLSVTTSYSYYRLYETDAFNISIEGLDEFVTAADWKRIWRDHVEPLQKRLWRQRGGVPQGRRTIEVTRLHTFMPLYTAMVRERIKIPQLLANTGQRLSKAMESIDQETVRRALRDIKQLLSPEE